MTFYPRSRRNIVSVAVWGRGLPRSKAESENTLSVQQHKTLQRILQRKQRKNKKYHV
jgi:hypothetical protein